MSAHNQLLHTPEGVKDYMPREFMQKTHVERRMESVFQSHGYAPVSSPMFEYADVFDEKGSVAPSSVYKFIDRDGSVLALRSDMTPQIARIAATSCHAEDVPMRFCYVSNAFRYNESYRGKLKEFTQAGVELIGIQSDEANAEVIALSVDSLLAAGLKDFRIDIGQVQFFQGILEEGGFDEETCRFMRESVIARDYVAVENAAKNSNAPAYICAILSELPLLIGGASVLEAARKMTKNETALAALQNLENIYDILCAYGVEQYVAFDLGMVGHLDYYTSIIFRGYAYGTGSSVLDGGRYDNLIAQFGADYPSVGFAIKIGVLLSALEGQDDAQTDLQISADTLIVYTEVGRRAACKAATLLRSQGHSVENSLFGSDLSVNVAYAARRKMGGVLYFEDAEYVTVIDIVAETRARAHLSELLGGKELS